MKKIILFLLFFVSTTFLIHAQCSGVTTTWNGTSWDNGIPDINDIVIIDGEYKTKINGNFEACELTVNSGNKLIINGNNSYVKVNGNIVKNGKILIRPKASLVQVDNNATITGSGLAKVKIKTTNLQDTDRFTYLSTPTATQDASVFSWNSQIWEFGQADQFWDYLGDGTYTGALEVSKGYAIRTGSSGTITMEFIGAFNNGIYTQPLVFNVGTHEPTVLDGDDDATLVGNPYPSGINLLGADGLFANNADLGQVLVWTHESSLDLGTGEYVDDDYIVCTSGGCNTNKGTTIVGGIIATGQGFFVDALANGTLTFNNAMRATTGNNQLKNSEQDKIWLTLISDIGYSKNVLVNFTNNGSDKFDPQLDATHSYNTTHGMAFYAISDTNDKLSIEDSGTFNESTSIPFGFIINDSTISEFTLTIEDIQNLTNTNVYIIDHLLNTTYDLKSGDYSFSTTGTGTFNDRLEIVLTRNALAVTNELISNDALIVSNLNENQINIKLLNENPIVNFKAFDILGKLIIETRPNANNFIIDTHVKKGQILLIKVTLENGQVISNKFMKL